MSSFFCLEFLMTFTWRNMVVNARTCELQASSFIGTKTTRRIAKHSKGSHPSKHSRETVRSGPAGSRQPVISHVPRFVRTHHKRFVESCVAKSVVKEMTERATSVACEVGHKRVFKCCQL